MWPLSFLSSSRVISDQWNLRCQSVAGALPGPYSAQLPTFWIGQIPESRMYKLPPLWTCFNCQDITCTSSQGKVGGAVLLILSLMETLLVFIRYFYTHASIWIFTIILWGTIVLQFKEKYQCSERPGHLSKGTQSRKGTRLQPQL